MAKRARKQVSGEMTQVGVIGVDAGLCWIGDPCYVLHKKQLPTTLGKNWDGFCNLLIANREAKSFNYEMGHEGLGVCVSTGYGDGVYPVYVIKDKKSGRNAGVFIDFKIKEMGKMFDKLLKK